MERDGASRVSSVESNSKRSGGGVLLAVLALVVGLALGGVVGIFGVGPMLAQRLTSVRLAPPSGAESYAPDLPVMAPGVIYELDNLIVNPAGSRGTRFLVVSLAVEVDSESTATALADREPAARDAVIHLLGSKTVAELSDIAGRDSLKVELIETLSVIIGAGRVLQLYLPQYVIQ